MLCCTSQCQAFFKHAGETIVLLENQNCQSWFSEFGPSLLPSTRTDNLNRATHVVLIYFQAGTPLLVFATSFIRSSNLHTLHVLHAHTTMTTAIKNGFEAVTLTGSCTMVIYTCYYDREAL